MILTFVGKVDTRSIVYPLARALSLQGLVAVVTDDGAYRRLYKGIDNEGHVSGVDIYTDIEINENTFDRLTESGISYDTIIVVSRNYVHKKSDSVIVCHGVDESMTRVIEEEHEEQENTEKKPKKKFGRKKNTEVIEEKQVRPSIKIIEDEIEPDIPEKATTEEIFVSFMNPSNKQSKGLLLREGYIQYVYSCEERKELSVIPDKTLNKLLAELLSKAVKIDAKELVKLLSSSEYNVKLK